MRKAVPLLCGLTSAGVAFAAALILFGSCSPRGSGKVDFRDSCTRIDSLRVTGRYEEALEAAVRLDSFMSQGHGRAWQREDAHRLAGTLRRIASLPAAGRRDMAEADSLTPVIERLITVDEDYVAAMNTAARQLELRSRRLGPTDPDVAASLHLLGRIANQSGEGQRCEEYLQRALAIRRARLGPRHPLVAETLREWGILMKTRLELPKAESAYLEALSILESSYPRGDPSLAPVLESLGSLSRLLKRFDAAEDYYVRALEIRRRHSGRRSIEVAENLIWLGYARMYASRLGPAEEVLLKARDILRERHSTFSHDMGDVLWNLATIAWLRGDTGRAADFWEQYSLCQTNAPGSHPQGFGLVRLRGMVGEWIDALLCEGRFDAAWQEICRDSGPAAQSLLNLSEARRRWSGEGGRLDSLRAEVLSLRRRVKSSNPSGGMPGTPPGPGGVFAASTEADDSLETRLARVDGQRMVLEQELLTRYSASPEGNRVGPEGIQSRLNPEQAMVGWVPGYWGLPGMLKGTLWAYVLRNNGRVHWIHLGTWQSTAEYQAWSQSLLRLNRAALRSSQWPVRVARDPGLDSLAADSWRKVFQPLLPYLAGARELIIVEGRTTNIKLVPIVPECLVDDAGVPLIEHFAISYVPSPVVFARLVDENRRNPNPDRSIIAMGDPLGPPRSPAERAGYALPEDGSLCQDIRSGPTLVSPLLFRSALAGNREALRQLPRLPDSRREVFKAASVFSSSTVFVGTEATRSALASALRRADQLGVLHLATHALVDGEQPERSLLVMSPVDAGTHAAPAADSLDSGYITAEEVLLGREIKVDLVTLSGCQTYQGVGGQCGEDLGFAQSFLAAGARCLLLSRWKVDDQATALLMGRFYENMTGSYRERRGGAVGAPMSKTRALQEAQIWLKHWRAPDGGSPFAHPVYWAGFVLFGAAG